MDYSRREKGTLEMIKQALLPLMAVAVACAVVYIYVACRVLMRQTLPSPMPPLRALKGPFKIGKSRQVEA